MTVALYVKKAMQKVVTSLRDEEKQSIWARAQRFHEVEWWRKPMNVATATRLPQVSE